MTRTKILAIAGRLRRDSYNRRLLVNAASTPYGATWAQADLRKNLGLAGADVVDRELAVHSVYRGSTPTTGYVTRHCAKGCLRSSVTSPPGLASDTPRPW